MARLAIEILTEPLSDDGRGAVRRTLRLPAAAHYSAGVDEAVVLNISETGLLIESRAKLAVGDTIFLDLPNASATAARVVWRENSLAGCQFTDAMTTGSTSGALLKASLESEELQQWVEPWEADDTSLQTATLIISMIVSGVALFIFLVAVFAS